MGKLDGHKLLQVWQYGNNSSLTQEIQKAKDYGFTGLLVKAIDGVNFMSLFDYNSDALADLEHIERQRDLCHNNGLLYCTWGVPKRENIKWQAELNGTIANLVDAHFLDVEPYNGFWGAWGPSSDVDLFMKVLREVAPTAYVVLQPDPRQARLNEIWADLWMEYCDAFSGQHYFETFGTTGYEEYGRILSQGVYRFAGKDIYPTLPSACDYNDLKDLLSALNGELGDNAYVFKGLVVWRSGVERDGILNLYSDFIVKAKEIKGDETVARTSDQQNIINVLNGWTNFSGNNIPGNFETLVQSMRDRAATLRREAQDLDNIANTLEEGNKQLKDVLEAVRSEFPA